MEYSTMPSPTAMDATGPYFALRPSEARNCRAPAIGLNDDGPPVTRKRPEIRITVDSAGENTGDEDNAQFLARENYLAMQHGTASSPTTGLRSAVTPLKIKKITTIKYVSRLSETGVIIDVHYSGEFRLSLGSHGNDIPDVSLVSERGSIKAGLSFDGPPRTVAILAEAGQDPWMRSSDVDVTIVRLRV